MDDQVIEKRLNYANGLRALADLLEERPEVPLPSYGDTMEMSIYVPTWDAVDPKQRLAEAVRAVREQAGVELQKDVTDSSLHLGFSLHGLKVSLFTSRDVVCTRRVVGTETVTRTGKDPALLEQLPDVEIEEEREIVEWDCAPVLAGELVRDGAEGGDAEV